MTSSRFGAGTKLAACMALFGWLAVGTSFSRAQQRDERAVRAVRAAYVFNLTKYVEWPEAQSEIIIGFVGDRSTGERLRDLLEGKTSGPRPIHVLLAPSEQELSRCTMLYLTEPLSARLRATLDKPDNRNILTVGEDDSFVKQHGMVGLVKVGDQIQIQVNLEETQRAGVHISSRLLELAVIYKPAPGTKN
ncbi:MAG TPA: YfiR family protein [Terriglobales bacterium]|nr:YfiR family protein [Terriglobales bacterium]